MSNTDELNNCPECKKKLGGDCPPCGANQLCTSVFKGCKLCYVSICLDNGGKPVEEGSNQYVIIGVVAGCLGLVAVIIFAWLVVRARRRKQYEESYQSKVKLSAHQRNASAGSLAEDSAFGIQSIFNNNDPANSNSGVYSDTETFHNTQISTQRTSLFGSLGNNKNKEFAKSTLSFSSVTADNANMPRESFSQPGKKVSSQVEATRLSNRESVKQGTSLSLNTRMENFHMTKNFDNMFDTKILPTPPGHNKF